MSRCIVVDHAGDVKLAVQLLLLGFGRLYMENLNLALSQRDDALAPSVVEAFIPFVDRG